MYYFFLTLWVFKKKQKKTITNVLLINSLSANPTKWSNTPKQFVGILTRNRSSVFGHFVRLALKGLKQKAFNYSDLHPYFRRRQLGMVGGWACIWVQSGVSRHRRARCSASAFCAYGCGVLGRGEHTTWKVWRRVCAEINNVSIVHGLNIWK